jgi:flagellar basal body-associated protein FliL
VDEEPRRGLGERLRELTEAISGRMIGILAGIVLLLAVGVGGAVYLFSRSPTPASTASPAEPSAPARPTDIAGMIEAAPETPVPASAETQTGSTPAEPKAANAQPAPEAAAGALALETLNLFDGRDPSVAS